MQDWQHHFSTYRQNIVGIDAVIPTPYGEKPLIYADWIASGRLYAPIEQQMGECLGPYVANTHSESSYTGQTMTEAYHAAHQEIKNHVNAGEEDVIITAGFGMTAVVNKLQRMMGIRLPEHCQDFIPGVRSSREQAADQKPVVFVTHMEHHSNHISWLETMADVVVVPPNEDGLVSPQRFAEEVQAHQSRPLKIGAFTAASNVSGIIPDYRELARVMHRHGGLAFVDFAASAPYVPIDMHPQNDPYGGLDAVFFSPHKFLGGPGSSGVVVFHAQLYKNLVPDHPGGGTVSWTNRWNERRYVSDIEAREDGGTPGFLQAIRAAMAVRLKEQMGCDAMAAREAELLHRIRQRLRPATGLHLLADGEEERIGVISFYMEHLHHNLVVRLLNDRFGVQVRGGCSCAGTYGHYLLNVSRSLSSSITEEINRGDLTHKPGWVRLSLHPTMTNEELDYVANAIEQVLDMGRSWAKDYDFHPPSGEYSHKTWRSPQRDWLALGN